jgi:outer membrane protein TolC
VELSVPLSNRGPRNIYRNARSELRRLALQKKSLENTIVLEVDKAIRTIKNLSTRVLDLEEDVRLKQQLLRDEKSKLEVGRTIAYTVSTIENDLVASQTEALRANADLQAAKADFYRATGMLLQRHHVFLSD